MLTVYVQDQHFVVRRREIRVAGHAHQAGVQVLSTHTGEDEMVARYAICAVLKGLVQDRVVQVPSDIRPGSSCVKEEEEEEKESLLINFVQIN